jgi:hypothetical protein
MTSWWDVPTIVAVWPKQVGAVVPAIAASGWPNTKNAMDAVPRAMTVLSFM